MNMQRETQSATDHCGEAERCEMFTFSMKNEKQPKIEGLRNDAMSADAPVSIRLRRGDGAKWKVRNRKVLQSMRSVETAVCSSC